MTRTLAIIIVGLFLLSLGMACAPKTQTTPAPAPASTPPSNLPPVRHDEAFFRQLGPQLKFTTGSVLDSARALARGEAPLGWNSISTVNPLIKDGAPIKPIVLQEGAISSYSSVLSIVKNAPHPNASREFLTGYCLKTDNSLLSKTRV